MQRVTWIAGLVHVGLGWWGIKWGVMKMGRAVNWQAAATV